jgi:hypothetical protein
LVDTLSTSLQRTAARNPQGTDLVSTLPSAPLWAEWLLCLRAPLVPLALSIHGIGLTRAVLLTALETNHLEDLCPLGLLQEAGNSGTEGTRAFYPDALQRTEPVRPVHELFVAGRCGGDTLRVPRRLPRSSRATATWKSLWVSTPRVIPAASVGMHRMFFLPSG